MANLAAASVPRRRGKNFKTNMSAFRLTSVLQDSRSKSWRSPFGPEIVAVSVPVYQHIQQYTVNASSGH